ncbi:MAG: M3 family oligoendopeptidase [bacterium]
MTLPQPIKHEFTPSDRPAGDLSVLEGLHNALVAMPTDSGKHLMAYLQAWNEFDAWVGEHVRMSQLATQLDTTDAAAQAHWMHLVANVIPTLSQWDDQLGKKLLASEAVNDLIGTPFEPFVRQVRKGVELFREENIALHTRESELENDYNKISGAWLTEFQGGKHTRSGMMQFLVSPDRDVRKSSWEALAQTTLNDADALDDVWEGLFELRGKIAHNCGYENYRDYIFAAKMRDYGPDACFAYHELIAEEVVPLAQEVNEMLQGRLGLESWRPWDSMADPTGGEPLRPFKTATELQDGVERMMRRLDAELGEQFHLIREHQDLESRPGKSQGGFMMTLPMSRRPYIFMNASGMHSDVVTMLHEAGHAFHFLLSTHNRPMASTSVPMEFNEVASMSMELLHYETLDEFYPEDDRKRAIHQHLRRIPSLLTSVARGDAFQHELYTKLDHTREQRHSIWLEQDRRFSTGVNWDGIDQNLRSKSWHSILHFFVVPFYYIEYGFAQLGALQVAMNADKDPIEALSKYRNALSLGPQADTEGLYAAAGAQFVPTRERVREMMNWIRRGLEL